MLSVSDTGCGMSEEFVARHLFRPFSTTKTGGIGIGLFQSRRIVEAHRGKIEVQSQRGQDRRFGSSCRQGLNDARRTENRAC